jgi:hypothetical protein
LNLTNFIIALEYFINGGPMMVEVFEEFN